MQDLSGLQFGKFQISKLIGLGGFAVVYEAFDTEMACTVALKILNKQWLSKPQIVNAFINEGETLTKLKHSNIVTAYKVGRQYGIPFYSMEYLTGYSLSQLLEDASLQQLLCLNLYPIFQQISHAIVYLHSKNLIHADITPSNIFVGQNHDSKLIDLGTYQQMFGISLRENLGIGTPKYMSPEQKAQKILSPKTDVYSFTLIVKEALEKCLIHLSPEAELLLFQCLHTSPSNRPINIDKVIDTIFKGHGGF